MSSNFNSSDFNGMRMAVTTTVAVVVRVLFDSGLLNLPEGVTAEDLTSRLLEVLIIPSLDYAEEKIREEEKK